jgi:hypothetical protein
VVVAVEVEQDQRALERLEFPDAAQRAEKRARSTV